MYRSEKKQAMLLLDSIIEMGEYAKKKISSRIEALSECLSGLNILSEHLEKLSQEYQEVWSEAVLKQLGGIDLDGTDEKMYQNQVSAFIASLRSYRTAIYNLPVRLKMLFLPYKASMWTAMESIWKAAQDDENCDAIVVVIPYKTFLNGLNGTLEMRKLEYDGDQFPIYVPITFYQNYSIEEQHPDVIFIHNPYDDQNNLTRVPEAYYTTSLKKHTDLLVYSPYYTVSSFPKKGNSNPVFLSPGMLNADLIITQCNDLKSHYISLGYPDSKLLTLGSPKADAIINPIEKTEIPLEWKRKSKGKICILFNCHFSFIMVENSICSQVDRLEWHLRSALDKKNCVLIFRPHPLCEQMLESRGMTQALSQFKKLKNLVKNSDNGILDEQGDYRLAFELSDAYLTTSSSLDNEYLLTGKPILIIGAGHRDYFLDSKDYKENHYLINRLFLYNFGDFSVYPTYPTVVYADPKNEELNLYDYQFEYYNDQDIGFVKRCVSLFRNYIDALEKGIDPLKNQRIQELKNAFLNLDGTCGEKIYRVIIQKLKVRCI